MVYKNTENKIALGRHQKYNINYLNNNQETILSKFAANVFKKITRFRD